MHTPARQKEWCKQLDNVINHWRNQPFIWGKYDCIHFAYDAVCAVSAKNWSQLDLPAYKNAMQAYNVMKRWGFDDLCRLVDALLGCHHSHHHARRGDLIAVSQKKLSLFSFALGVCLGDVCAAPGKNGLVFFPTSTSQFCWRI